MNIAYLLKPKSSVAYLQDTNTIRQGLEKINHHGYTAVPVLTEDGRYAGTVSEGDFLWYIIKGENGEVRQVEIKSVECTRVRDILRQGKNPPVHVTATVEELLGRVLEQNFVPVVGARGYFMGIITRRDVIQYFYAQTLSE